MIVSSHHHDLIKGCNGNLLGAWCDSLLFFMEDNF